MSPRPNLDDRRQRLMPLLEAARQTAEHMGWVELARSCSTSSTKLSQSDVLIGVVGQYKQGKSSLINGLLGEQVCPVDDDIATAVPTVLVFGGEPEALAFVRRSDQVIAEPLGADEVTSVVCGDPTRSGERVQFVQVRVRNPLLASGISFLDGPGVGGLNSTAGDFVLGYLGLAHAVLFVTDAATPLSREELGYLQQVQRECRNVAVVVTKKDLYAEWRPMVDIDREMLSSKLPIFSVSNQLRSLALERLDADLNHESGYPALLRFLQEDVLAVALEQSFDDACEDAERVFVRLHDLITDGVRARENPESTEGRLRELQSLRTQLDGLRSASSRWQVVLNDGFGDLSSEVDFRYRKRIRELTTVIDKMVEEGDPLHCWDEISDLARQRLAEMSRNVVRELEAGTDDLARRIVTVLADEELGMETTLGVAEPARLSWTGRGADIPKASLSAYTGRGITGLRGAQSGVMLLGLVANLSGVGIPATALFGVAAIFGGKGIIEDRRRGLTQRRQAARTAFRQALDENQFEVTRVMRELGRDLQRKLRDHFSSAISEAHRAATTRIEALQRADDDEQTSVAAFLAQAKPQLAQLETTLSTLCGLRVVTE
jgi:hypothetical protein